MCIYVEKVMYPTTLHRGWGRGQVPKNVLLQIT